MTLLEVLAGAALGAVGGAVTVLTGGAAVPLWYAVGSCALCGGADAALNGRVAFTASTPLGHCTPASASAKRVGTQTPAASNGFSGSGLRSRPATAQAKAEVTPTPAARHVTPTPAGPELLKQQPPGSTSWRFYREDGMIVKDNGIDGSTFGGAHSELPGLCKMPALTEGLGGKGPIPFGRYRVTKCVDTDIYRCNLS